jgi:glycosyltransferase involved in cell wall biosynthesis
MCVRNGALDLPRSVASVLDQDVDLELVVVDDGSTDRSRQVLDELAAQDRRVRVFHQEQKGLTAGLVRGCAEARGAFIARQDADDRSLPNRLKRQVERLRSGFDDSLVSCWTNFVGPGGELLYTLTPGEASAEARRRLRAPDVSVVRGIPGHGTALFRRGDYLRVGGYREAFFFAQDLDLWLRLTDAGGGIGFVPEVLYEVRLSPESISTRHRLQQIELAGIMLALARVREEGGSEEPLLQRAATIRPDPGGGPSRWDRARGLYFIGRCLQQRRDRRAAAYFRAAVRQQPLHLRAWTGLLLSAGREGWGT